MQMLRVFPELVERERDWREGGFGEKWRAGGGQGEGQDSPHSAWPRLGMSTRSGGLGGIGPLLGDFWGICSQYFYGSQYPSTSVGTKMKYSEIVL